MLITPPRKEIQIPRPTSSNGVAVTTVGYEDADKDPTPDTEPEDVADPVALDDRTLDAVDRKIIEVVQKLEQAGVRATDELVASRLPPNPQTDISYHRVTVNKRRCKLREKGYNV